ncbi:MAG: tryptophan 7-halogenase [Sandaracinaceae bacterium]|nr:tryptophan 7-halogenase [Sandaracinaceae bacterium]
MPKVDVAILGGGLAGNLLALQLRKHTPGVSVAVFEKSTTRGYKVGESTVEVATHYLIRRMGLSTYTYKEHLPKNGLRFFFDTPERDSELTEMSEIGVDSLPPYPSFQLDRARLERDLIEMNRAAGVDLHMPAEVSDLELASDGGPHRFRVTEDQAGSPAQSQWEARWVVDTTGRPGLIAKARDLRIPEPSHHIAASWARMTDVLDMDAIDAPAWQKRARWTSRMLSTTHFMYPGYWIWFIPLREGITSVGIVCDKSQWDRGMAREEGFRAFINKHKATAKMIENAKMIDIGAYNQLAFRTKRFYSGAERWACVGDAGAFTDPFYSPGSDFIALGNDFTADLITRDFKGETTEAVHSRSDLYDAFIKYRFETTMAIYDQMYETFGSYDLFRAKIFFDTALYYNLIFDAYVSDLHLDEKWLRGELRRKEWGIQTMQNFRALFRGAAKELHARGDYFKGNQGKHSLDGRSTFGVLEPVGQMRKRRQVNARSEEVFAKTQTMLRELFGGKADFLDEMLKGERDLFDAWTQLGTEDE